MRGLTPLERRTLTMAASPEFHGVVNDPPALSATQRLRKSGRVYDAGGYVFHATDLGRLALRCCPIGEDVSK